MKYEDFINSTKYRREYDEIIPLGFDCGMCFAVKSLFVRQHSYPFDWGRVVESKDDLGFRRKIELLCTNFRDFINESDLCIVDDNHKDENEPNMSVSNMFNGMHFAHDFPKGKTIAESYPFVKEKYDRRIKRLINLINSGKKICFCFYTSFAELPKSEIIYSTDIFYKVFPNAKVDFLILQNRESVADNIICEELSNSVRCVFFYDEIHESGIGFKNGLTKLEQMLNVFADITNKKHAFVAKELESDYHDGDVITNPTPDFNGIISYGPYAPLNFGDHTVTVDYDVTENYDGFVDVACDHGDTIILPRTELPHNQKTFKIDLHLDKLVSDLEVRFYGVPRDTTDKTNKFQLFGIHID